MASDLAYVRALTDAVRIEELYQQACEQEKALQASLSEWQGNHPEVVSALESIVSAPSTLLVPIAASVADIEALCRRPCELAGRVSSEVHRIDGAKIRVEETERRIEEIVDLKHCMSSVRSALSNGEFESAAASVHRYLQLDESVLDSHSRDLLKAAQAEMKTTVGKRLDEAIAEGNEESVRRFCRLYPPLGAEEEGLARYTGFLRRRCAVSDEKIHRALQRFVHGGNAASASAEGAITVSSFVDALTRICEGVASVAQSQVTGKAADPLWVGSAGPVLRALQAQCDVDGCRIFDAFLDRHNVAQRVAEIQGRRGTELRVDPRELPPLLEEMALMCQTVELFEAFLKNREREAINAALADSPPQPHPLGSPRGGRASASSLLQIAQERAQSQAQRTTATSLLPCSELSRRAQELMGTYVTLEEYYISESSRVIVRTEELNRETVDMVFYVLQRSASRSLITCNANCVCVCLGHVVSVIGGDLLETVTRGLHASPTVQRAAATLKDLLQPQLAPEQPLTKALPWALLDCLDQGAEDAVKLHEVLKTECERLFSAVPSSMAKVSSCLDDLSEAAKPYRAALTEGLDAQCRQHILPRIRPQVELLAASRPSYELSSAEYAMLEAGDASSFVQFALFIENLCGQLEPILTPSNYEGVAQRVLGHAAEKVEHVVLQHKFNQLGALQLDRDIRALQGQLSAGRLPRRATRERLARLSQVALFLNLEVVEEAGELWNDGTGRTAWRLAPAEIRRILSLRVDFSRDKIALLRL